MTPDLFTQIKLEMKQGHTLHYSALLHDLSPTIIQTIREAHNYTVWEKVN